MHALLNIAVMAARRAGEVIVRSLNRLESLTVTSKGRNDFVSEVDRAAAGLTWTTVAFASANSARSKGR